MSSEINRLSVIVDKEVQDQLRSIQANMIKESKKNISFSYVVNLTLKEGLKTTSKNL